MTMKKINDAVNSYVARGGGGVIAETKQAVILSENGQSDRVFFPKSDVAMVLFDPSSTSALDAHLGEVTYYTLAGKSVAIADAAWSYEAANGEFSRLVDFITFDSNKVTVEAV